MLTDTMGIALMAPVPSVQFATKQGTLTCVEPVRDDER